MHKNATPNIEEALEYAVDAIDRGDLQLGNAALTWVLERDPSNRIALVWMACTVPDEHAKRTYYSLIRS